MNSRLQNTDLMKGLAVILMIQVHIIELFASQTISSSAIGKFLLFLGGPLVAPVFAFFLGYFLMDSKKTSQQLLVRGLQLFILGMCLNVVLNLNLIISVNKGLLKIDVWPYLFGVDILQFAGLATLILTALKKIVQRSYLMSIFLATFSAFLGHYLLRFIPDLVYLKYISAFFYGSVTWSYFPLFPWLVYPFAGIAFYLLKQKVNITKFQNGAIRMLALTVFLFFLATTLLYAVRTSSVLQSYYHHGILFALWTLFFLAFYSYFVNEINHVVGKNKVTGYIKWLGKHVTVIYVLQWILIGNLATAVYKTISSPLNLILSFVGITFASSMLCFIYLKIRNARKNASVS